MKSGRRAFLSGAAERMRIFPALVWISFGPFAACGGNFYADTSPTNVPWSNGIVPYEFTNTLSAAQQQTYLDGLREWELAANVKFVPHTNQTRWILFTYNTNFLDFVSGGSYNPQVVTVSSLSRAQVCHEMGHSFGFTHENIRPDQTSYLTILTNNINEEPTNIFWFTIDPTSVTNGNYDFESVMHLGWDFASTNPGVLATQQPRPPYFPRYQFRMGNFCLSPGDRAALQYLYGPPAVPLANIVTTTADVGFGSLRAALYYVTDHPGSVVQFNIPTNDPGYSNGVFNIHLTGHLPPLVSNGMVIDGSTQPGFTGKPLIVVDGSQIIPESFTSNSGLLIYASSNQVKNISFQGFNWNGLTLEYADATNNTIAGCWLGLDYTGSNAASNAYQGILFALGASHNIVGGTNALARNIISGNGQYGLWMSDTNTTGNVILGNYIGTDASGSFAVPNALGGIGIFYNGVGHVIGGTNAAAGNVISGNGGTGIWLAGTNVNNVIVQGNYIGLNAAGTAGIPNISDGVNVVGGATGNTIGGTGAGTRNVISGNQAYGIYISDPGTSNNFVLGNYIGTDITGTNALGNGNIGIGILTNTSGNTIGGTTAGAGNLLSGNTNYGIAMIGVSGNVIQGNYIGTDVSGKTALANGNQTNGIGLWNGSANNLIGGTGPGAGNLISGNQAYGIYISDPGTSNNFVLGNFIGTDVTGTNAIGDGGFGIGIWSSANGNFIGGTTPGAGNLISGNPGFSYGIAMGGVNGTVVQGNFVGTDFAGKKALANGFAGVGIYGASLGNLIGGTTAAAANLISGNGSYGVFISDPGTSGNFVQGNFIGTDVTGTNALGNGTASFYGANVELQSGASGNFIGGTSAGARNVIAFSSVKGVLLFDATTTNDAIRGNSIFGNTNLGIDLGNVGVTLNHTGFLAGPNDLQNYPVITNAYGYAASTIVSGTLNSLTNQAYFIDVYRNLNADPSGYGQGQFYVGTVSVTTDGSGNAGFSLTNNTANYSGQYFTATATSSGGDTSEFGADMLAINVPAPSAQFTGPFQSRTNGFAFGLTLQTNFNYRIQAATNLAAPIVWTDLTNFLATNSLFPFTDRTATNYRVRFYRVISP
jgi:hypothetical protein